MALDAARVNTARQASIYADLQTQFPINADLLPAEKARIFAYFGKLAHAIADQEGTDIVAEITGHAVVPAGQTCATPNTLTGTVTSAGTVT